MLNIFNVSLKVVMLNMIYVIINFDLVLEILSML